MALRGQAKCSSSAIRFPVAAGSGLGAPLGDGAGRRLCVAPQRFYRQRQRTSCCRGLDSDRISRLSGLSPRQVRTVPGGCRCGLAQLRGVAERWRCSHSQQHAGPLRLAQTRGSGQSRLRAFMGCSSRSGRQSNAARHDPAYLAAIQAGILRQRVRRGYFRHGVLVCGGGIGTIVWAVHLVASEARQHLPRSRKAARGGKGITLTLERKSIPRCSRAF